MTLYVGVDGGGTSCRVRVRDAAGRERGGATSGSANVYLDYPGAVRVVADAIEAALSETKQTNGLFVGCGLAGVSSPEVGARVAADLARFGSVIVTHDGDTACLGAHAGADGGLIIAGTGSGGVVRVGGRSLTVGGRGFILGDDGSGARLGLEAMRLALRAQDGLAEHSGLTRRLLARFGDDIVAAIEWGRTARSSDFASLAPWIVEAGSAGDANALHLLYDAGAAIAALAAALERLGAPRLSFVGGLSDALRPYLPDTLRRALQPPRYDALDGALLLAGCPGLPLPRP